MNHENENKNIDQQVDEVLMELAAEKEAVAAPQPVSEVKPADDTVIDPIIENARTDLVPVEEVLEEEMPIEKPKKKRGRPPKKAVEEDAAPTPAAPARKKAAKAPVQDEAAVTEMLIEDATAPVELPAEPVADPEPAPAPVPKDMSLVYTVRDEEEDLYADIPEKYKSRGMQKLVKACRKMFPNKRDSGKEKLRKSVLVLSVVALISSVVYMVYDMVYVPFMNEQTYGEIGELYNPDAPVDVPIEYDNVEFPSGMTNVLKAMYAQNSDLRGFLTYQSDDGSGDLDIAYPVMWSGDNDFYLNRDFYKKKNANGALFFDEENWSGIFQNALRTTIIYGHNNINGQMFSDIIPLCSDIDKARNATTISLETLYGHETYRVFAIAMFDEDADVKYYFDYRQKTFNSDGAFLDFMDEIRARSYWNYDGVDVRPNDNILVLSTCTTESTSKLKNGRIAVFARQLRSHEVYENDPSSITKNKKVLMPYAWYVNHKKKVPDYYTSKLLPTTTASGSTTTTTEDGDATTTEKEDGTTKKTTTKKSTKKTTTTKSGKSTTTTKKTTTVKKPTSTTATTTVKSTKETTTKQTTTTTTVKSTKETTTKKTTTTAKSTKETTTTKKPTTTTTTTEKPSTTTTTTTTTAAETTTTAATSAESNE